MFQSSVRINVGPNRERKDGKSQATTFQSSVRINVGPNAATRSDTSVPHSFQSSVRINVGPNPTAIPAFPLWGAVSILRED